MLDGRTKIPSLFSTPCSFHRPKGEVGWEVWWKWFCLLDQPLPGAVLQSLPHLLPRSSPIFCYFLSYFQPGLLRP